MEGAKDEGRFRVDEGTLNFNDEKKLYYTGCPTVVSRVKVENVVYNDT